MVDYKLVATAIWRATYIKDKNKIRQQAKEAQTLLIVHNLVADFRKNDPEFDENQFYKLCGLGW